MIRTVEEIVKLEQIDARLVILDSLDDYVRFNTWVLPSLFINGKAVARGYTPLRSDLAQKLKEADKGPEGNNFDID